MNRIIGGLLLLLGLLLVMEDCMYGQMIMRRRVAAGPAGPKASDNFDRADALLAASSNWTMVPNSYDNEIVSNRVCGVTNNKEHATYWSADTFADSQYAIATFYQDALDNVDFAGVAVRCSNSNEDYYGMYVSADGTGTVQWYLFSVTNTGGLVTIASGSGATCSNGDTLKIMVGDNATTNRVRGKINSTTLGEDDNVDHSSGWAGVTCYDRDEDNFIDNWSADDGEPD